MEGFLQLDCIQTIVIVIAFALLIAFASPVGRMIFVHVLTMARCRREDDRGEQLPHLVEYVRTKPQAHQNRQGHEEYLPLLVRDLRQVAVVEEALHFAVDIGQLAGDLLVVEGPRAQILDNLWLTGC